MERGDRLLCYWLDYRAASPTWEGDGRIERWLMLLELGTMMSSLGDDVVDEELPSWVLVDLVMVEQRLWQVVDGICDEEFLCYLLSSLVLDMANIYREGRGGYSSGRGMGIACGGG